jgi:hypothetical protein
MIDTYAAKTPKKSVSNFIVPGLVQVVNKDGQGVSVTQSAEGQIPRRAIGAVIIAKSPWEQGLLYTCAKPCLAESGVAMVPSSGSETVLGSVSTCKQCGKPPPEQSFVVNLGPRIASRLHTYSNFILGRNLTS